MALISSAVHCSGGLASQKGCARRNSSATRRHIVFLIMPAIRRGQASDLAAVAAIEAASPGAAQWNAAQWNAAQWGGDSCLTHEFLVATEEGDVAGFLIGRAVAPGEREVLNLA